MMMLQSTLAGLLEDSVVPAETEAQSIINFVDAYADYCADAEAATPILPAGIELGKVAMSAALVGWNVPGTSAAKIVAGVQAFWGAVASGLTTSFAGAIAIVPPPLLVLPGILAVFSANILRDSHDAADAIATALHSGITGGTVTVGTIITPII